MVKLLELVKNYDEFKTQAPPPAPKEADERERGPTAKEGDDPLADPLLEAAHALGMISYTPRQPPASPEPEVRMPEPELAPDRAWPRQRPAAEAGPGSAPPRSSDYPTARTGTPYPPHEARPHAGTRMSSPAEPASPPVSAPADLSAAYEAGAIEAAKLYERALDQVARLFEAAAVETVSPGRLREVTPGTEEIAAELARAPSLGEALLVMALGTYPEGKGFVVPHSANVAVLAAYVGQELGLSQARLIDTCLAGLTHDLGNVKLADGILYKEGPLSPQEWDELRKRPEYGREILDSLGDRFRAVAEIAHQVYERMDGSGYPNAIEGEQILPEARILGAVDFFETVVHPRPYKDMPAGGVSYGLQTLMRMAGQFGQETLKALVRSVGLFPVGTYVRLSTGEIGRVLSSNKRNPMRPVVQVILDKKKRRTSMPRSIDLVKSPHLYVSKPLSSSDLTELGLLEESEAGDGAAAAASNGITEPSEPELPSDFRNEPGSSAPE